MAYGGIPLLGWSPCTPQPVPRTVVAVSARAKRD